MVNQDTQTAGTEMTNHRDLLDSEDINRTMEGTADHIYRGLETYIYATSTAECSPHHGDGSSQT